MPCGCKKKAVATTTENKVVSAKPNPSRPLNESGRSLRTEKRIIR